MVELSEITHCYWKYPIKPKVITKINATDPDSELNSKISFKILRTQPASTKSFFKIDENSGELSTTKEISTTNFKNANLTIRAFDSGSPQLFSDAILTIKIEDKNNHVPEIKVSPVRAFKNDNSIALVDENEEPGAFVAWIKVRFKQ